MVYCELYVCLGYTMPCEHSSSLIMVVCGCLVILSWNGPGLTLEWQERESNPGSLAL